MGYNNFFSLVSTDLFILLFLGSWLPRKISYSCGHHLSLQLADNYDGVRVRPLRRDSRKSAYSGDPSMGGSPYARKRWQQRRSSYLPRALLIKTSRTNFIIISYKKMPGKCMMKRQENACTERKDDFYYKVYPWTVKSYGFISILNIYTAVNNINSVIIKLGVVSKLSMNITHIAQKECGYFPEIYISSFQFSLQPIM